jgi:hypothetical protein
MGYTTPIRQDDGSILIPRRIEDGDAVGDQMVLVRPGEPEYDTWDRYLRRQEPAKPQDRPGWVQQTSDQIRER